jgi:putative transposase
MSFSSKDHQRTSIRLKGYDYTQSGVYFVTICTQNRENLFCDFVGDQLQLNDAGRMVLDWFDRLPQKFPDVITDTFVCMPNHVHFIVVIHPIPPLRDIGEFVGGHTGPPLRDIGEFVGGHTGPPLRDIDKSLGAHVGAPLRDIDKSLGAHVGAPLRDIDKSSGAHMGAPLPTMVQWLKTMTTNDYIRGVKLRGWLPFPGRLWQRNYYEHIIRDDISFFKIREYIANNPLQWAMDPENP